MLLSEGRTSCDEESEWSFWAPQNSTTDWSKKSSKSLPSLSTFPIAGWEMGSKNGSSPVKRSAQRSLEALGCTDGVTFSFFKMPKNGLDSEVDIKGLVSFWLFLASSINLAPGPSLVNMPFQGRETPRISICNEIQYRQLTSDNYSKLHPGEAYWINKKRWGKRFKKKYLLSLRLSSHANS